MRKNSWFSWAALALAGSVVFACSGSEDSSGPSGPCGELATQICDQACACTAGDCKLRYSSGSSQTLTPAQCPTAFGNSCNAGTIDQAMCSQVVSQAQCEDTGSGKALTLPAECSP